MKVLLFGANGQLGWELRRSLAPLAHVVSFTREAADFEQPESLAGLVDAEQPQAIVNAAAYTAVDQAELEPERAHRINAEAVGVLAQAAARHRAWLLHYSTDYVFDGTGQAPWHEDAPTAPLNVYGRSKLAGEQAVLASGCRHLILRTSWVYAARGRNFARTILQMAMERDRFTVVTDQFGAPTGADLLADISAHVLRAAFAEPSLAGTYHAAASGETSWHGYACFVIGWAHQHGHALKTAPGAIEAVPSGAFAARARRPHNSRLSTLKLQRQFGLHLPPWQVGVERMLRETLNAHPQEEQVR